MVLKLFPIDNDTYDRLVIDFLDQYTVNHGGGAPTIRGVIVVARVTVARGHGSRGSHGRRRGRRWSSGHGPSGELRSRLVMVSGGVAGARGASSGCDHQGIRVEFAVARGIVVGAPIVGESHVCGQRRGKRIKTHRNRRNLVSGFGLELLGTRARWRIQVSI